MTPLVAKEIRLLLPAYLLALVLAATPLVLALISPYGWPNGPAQGWSSVAIMLFGFGAGLLALTSFGREFGLNTFALQMAQPLERRRIWWTKVGVLAGALLTVVALWGLAWVPAIRKGWESPAWRETMLVSATIAAVAFAGGLWTTLLLRQVASAFWFSLLVPAAILVAVTALRGTDAVAFAAMTIYAVAGVLLAAWQFRHVQETMWTGGVVTLASWRRAGAVSRPSLRVWRPWAALFRKELQLQQVSLVAIAWLLLTHLGVVALRKSGHVAFGSGLRMGLEVFGGLWVIVPLLAGSPGVAEERKLGVTSAHLCLPISSRVQFAIKLLVTLLVGGLLSSFLLWSIESLGAAIGAPGDIGGGNRPPTGREFAVLCSAFLALALIGFYASTLARHIVQALAIAVATAFGVWLLVAICLRPFELFGVYLWHSSLALYIATPTLLVVFVWLSFRNFRQPADTGRLWGPNLLAWAATLAFLFSSATALYNRAWELVLPLEPARGPARLAGPSSPRPVLMYSYGGSGLAAVLSDGRLWVDRIWYDRGCRVLGRYANSGIMLGGKWLSLSGNQIAPGSNWVDVVANFRDTVAIRADGSLWVSERPREVSTNAEDIPPPIELGPPLVRFGQETDWQSVAKDISYESLGAVLLKTDGTLWRWSPNRRVPRDEWKGLRSFEPHRLGADSDWARIRGVGDVVYCWKRDGRAWALHSPPRNPDQTHARPDPQVDTDMVMTRAQTLDNLHCRSLVRFGSLHVAVRDDGTLWAWDTHPREYTGSTWSIFSPQRPVQVGQETNWVSIAGDWRPLAALKRDGSLWQWEQGREDARRFDLRAMRPLRLGTHNDWVAVGSIFGCTVSLAADGSLWYWWYRSPDPYYRDSDQPLLAPSRRPSKIENILAGTGAK